MTRGLAALLPVCLALLMLAASPADSATPLPEDDGAETIVRSRQWQLKTLRLAEAWKRSKGAGVLVAVLDTGADPHHPDLAGAVVQGPDLTRTPVAPGRWGRHGTGMASLIAGRGHGANGADGVLGIAPESTVLSIRVTLENDDPRREDDGARTRGHDALAKGIRYAADHGAQVISMSLGGGSGTWQGLASEEKAVAYALRGGAVLVASAGNDGEGANRRNFPAAYPGVIAVGAVGQDLRVAPFSNRQEYLSVVAPGRDIVSADDSSAYMAGDGTSSAAALVAGIAALVRSAYPELTPLQVRQAIELGTRPPPWRGHSAAHGHVATYGRSAAYGHSSAYGYGVADAARALAAAGLLPHETRAVPNAPGERPAPYIERDLSFSRAVVIVLLLLLGGAMTLRMVVLQPKR